MKKITYSFAVLFLIAVSSCHKNEIQYQTFEVAKRTLVKSVEANGSIETENTVEIYAPVSGRLEKLFVKEGEMVKARQKIGLVSSDARSAIIDMANGKSQEEVTYWKKQMQPTPIFATVDGKIILLKTNIGERANGSIGQISTGEIIRANLDEADLPSVTVGQKVEIHFDLDSKAKLTGLLQKVSQVSKLVNNVNVYQVEVSLPAEEQRKKVPFEIKIGMSVTLFFQVEEKKDALALPAGAVGGRSNATINVVKVDDQKVQVKLGGTYGDWVEVISGLEAGEKIKVPAFKSGQAKTRKSPLMIKKE